MHTRAAYRQQALQIQHMMDGMEAEARRKSASRVKNLKRKLSADKTRSRSKKKSRNGLNSWPTFSKSRSLASVERSRARKMKLIIKSKTRKTRVLVKKERASLKKKLSKIRRRKAKALKSLRLSCKTSSKTLSREINSLVPSGAQIDKLTKRSYKKLRKDVNGKLTEIGKHRTKCNKNVRS